MLALLRSGRFAHRRFQQSKQLPTTCYHLSSTADSRHASKPNRPSPPPIQVLLTESAGRGVFATRNIEPGELIHTAKPFVSHPSLSSINKVCYFCLKTTTPREGFDIDELKVSFCSEECREQAKGFYEVEKKADWSAFVDHCRNRALKYPLLAKRLACMVISGMTSAEGLDVLQPALLSAEMISLF